jgi:hypothetical protein
LEIGAVACLGASTLFGFLRKFKKTNTAATKAIAITKPTI